MRLDTVKHDQYCEIRTVRSDGTACDTSEREELERNRSNVVHLHELVLNSTPLISQNTRFDPIVRVRKTTNEEALRAAEVGVCKSALAFKVNHGP